MAQSTIAFRSSSESPAQLLVKSIAKDHGYLGDHVYAKMDVDTRREVQEAMLAKDKLIGGSVTVLARELYTKDVRFIFELLQNADDNHYSKATEANSEPFVTFHHYHNKVIVECNEDGFSEANIRAICSIGQSSKTGAQGYIGEKGIGFKSIFKVAWKAHIQSGPYCFAFIHRPGDLGMGMISPEWETSSERLDGPLTRITLLLHEEDNRRQKINVNAQRKSIKEQLQTLQSTMLLFLKKLKRVNIHFHEEQETTSISMNLDRDTFNARTILSRRETHGGQSTEEKTFYHVTTQIVTGLARSDNRNYSEAEESTRAYSRAEVILAFPLSEDSVPIVQPQEVFAFLPVRQYGFNFIIHSDFVTSANREDIVTSSPRNLGLLDGVAAAFVSAAEQMCDHETLQYQWMRYIDNVSKGEWGPFWQKLIDKIKLRIANIDILRPRRLGPLRRIEDLTRLGNIFLDEVRDPLFADLPNLQEKYLSSNYKHEDLHILEKFGLRWLYFDEFLQTVKHDLSLPSSRMKGRFTVDDWHTRAAKALNFSFAKNWDDQIDETKALSLLPLNDGRWVSSNDGATYFPTVGDGIIIPEDLGLQLLDGKACNDAARTALFSNLEVQNLKQSDARDLIIRRHASRTSFSLQASYNHLVFLYLTEGQKRVDSYRSLKLCNNHETSLSPKTHDFYFINDDPYSLWQLSRTDSLRTDVNFVHPKYLEDAPRQKSQKASWKDWLYELGIRRYPRLISPDGSALSSECALIAKSIPKKFLGFLRYAWNSDGATMIQNKDVLKQMKNTEVLCQWNTEDTISLNCTYLPLPNLKNQCMRFMEGDEFFPFLYLDKSLDKERDVADWKFLSEHLGVGNSDNWLFFVDMLYQIMRNHKLYHTGSEVERPLRIVELYIRIHSQCYDSVDKHAQQALVRKQMASSGMIYIPPWEDEEATWTQPSQCVLGAPRDMSHKFPIIARYQASFLKNDVDFAILTSFFRDTLGIETFSWKHCMEEIKALKSNDCHDFDRVRRQYEQLNKQRNHIVTMEMTTHEIRRVFEDDYLIFIPFPEGQSYWARKSSCLWSNATEIRGKCNLNTYYDSNLEDFFVKFLGVDRLNFSIVHDELLGVDPQSTPIEEVKDLIWSLNSFLTKETPKEKPEKLLKKAILPIRYPNDSVRLVTTEVDFAITDRRAYGEEFKDKVKILDFGLEEVHKLQPFLAWVKIEGRYLSRVVKEISVVESGVTYPLSDPKWEVKTKAHALVRLAVHLKSPRTRNGAHTLYDLLRDAETSETDGISAEHILSQDGKSVSVRVGSTEVHIDDGRAGLKVYVPHDPVSKEVCFFSALPKALAEWMMRDPVTNITEPYTPTAIKTITGVLGARKEAVGSILELDGIIKIDVPEPPVEDESEHGVPTTPQQPHRARSTSLSSEEGFLTPSTSLVSRTNRTFGLTTTLNSREENGDSVAVPVNGELWHSPSPGERNRQRVSTPPSSIAQVDLARREYSNLLEYMTHAARRTNFPSRGDCSSGSYTFQDRSALNEWLMFGSSSQYERDKKVGAAGELFVFELLSSLDPRLMNFSFENWQSTIRKYVTVHPDYAEMQPWSGRETSDIVYPDTNGTLTALLISKGYLDAHVWQTRNPLYYIEVKSTTEGYSTAFYMSDSQYHKMQQYSTDTSIYAIFRVFNMTKGSLGVKVYVDPDQMRRDGELKFEVDKWTVVPGR